MTALILVQRRGTVEIVGGVVDCLFSLYEWRVMERFVKMPHTFTHKEYADMVYMYGYCNGSANEAVDEYQRRYPLRRTPNRAVFTNVFRALRECGTLPSVRVIRTQIDTNS